MSVSLDRLTAIQTKAGNLSSQNQEKGVMWCEYATDLEEHPGQTVTHDRRRLSVQTDLTSRRFTHFPVSVAPRVRKERNHQHQCHMTPFKVGVD